MGKDPWHYSRHEEIPGIPPEIISLAVELNEDSGKLETALSYLNSPDAVSAGLLGEALAQLDANGRHMDCVLSTAAETGSNTLARGYIGRLLAIYPANTDRLNQWLDRLEKEAAELAYFVSLSAPKFTRPLERTLRLIRGGTLPVQALRNFIVGILLDSMSSDDLRTVLDLLVQAGDPQSLHTAVDFVAHSVQKGRGSDGAEREAMWRVLEASAPVDDQADFWWLQAIGAFAPDAPERACKVAILGLIGDDYEKQNHAWSVLSSVAKTHPDLVMDSVGQILLDQEHGWRLRIGARSGLFEMLPLDSVQRWLDKMGIEGARVIANHLQPPSLDGEGRPQIHPITEHVLANWGDDEAVFERFAASTHQLQMYSGDIASIHRKEAECARRFLSHPISAIRKWAEYEVALGEEKARQWTIRHEEAFLE